MQTEALTQIKRQIVSLDVESKRDLADFLAGEIAGVNESAVLPISDEARQNQLEWLKANRERYAGKYVALDETELVGEGATLREAREKAKEKGFFDPFVTFVYSESDVPFGGW